MILTKTNREHSFDVELAEIHGIQKAILLKNFDYWVRENERKQIEQFFMGGKYWTAESASSLANKYRYMPKSNIKRWVNELEDIGWLDIVKRQSDISFYRPGKVFELWNTGQDWQSAQNEPTEKNEHRPKMSQELAQNEPSIGPIRADNWPNMGHNNIDLNIEPNIEINIEDNAPISQKNENGYIPQPSVKAENHNTPPSPAAPPPDLKVTVFDPPTTETHTGPLGMVKVETFAPPRVEVLSAKSKKQTAAAQELQFAAEAIEYLNQKAGRSFRPNVASNAKGIIARYREGFNMEQIKKMVDHMCRKWGSDREMQDHLNPVTLFRDSNFEKYYQAAEAAAKLGPLTQPSQNGNYHRMTYNAPAPGKEMDF
jgi:uncharacterized phage protein (TIGR02220 family)